ncbi:MAG: CheC, inhibitor of MCP methylation [uncultured bacterium]|nr:MAG: CheC, inhibitor of MCP methylation [uncultured bacterium]HLD45396.1 chemotaxis protein CheC [bacterium]
MKELTNLQLDALREAGNIGAGHAAIALSQMMNKKVMMSVVRTEIVPSNVFLKGFVEEHDPEVAGVYLITLGDTQGAAIFMFQKAAALNLCDLLLTRQRGSTTFVDEQAQSALKELGSILTGSFFSVLSDMLHLNFFHKTPLYAEDDAAVILYGICDSVFGDRQERLCVTTEFVESNSRIKGSFVFIPTVETMQKFLTQLQV